MIENIAQIQQQLRELGTASASRYVFVQELLQIDLGNLGNRTRSKAAPDQRIFDQPLGGTNRVRTPTWFDDREILSGDLF